MNRLWVTNQTVSKRLESSQEIRIINGMLERYYLYLKYVYIITQYSWVNIRLLIFIREGKNIDMFKLLNELPVSPKRNEIFKRNIKTDGSILFC